MSKDCTLKNMMISFSLLSFHCMSVMQTIICLKAVAVLYHCHHMDSILLLWLCRDDLTLVCLSWLSYVCMASLCSFRLHTTWLKLFCVSSVLFLYFVLFVLFIFVYYMYILLLIFLLSSLQLFLCNYSIISTLWVYVFGFVCLPFAYIHTQKTYIHTQKTCHGDDKTIAFCF